MAKRIVINKGEFLGLYRQSFEIVEEIAKINKQAIKVAGKAPTGKFYKGEAEGLMSQYYTMLVQNIGVLTQAYSKAGEYLMYVQEEIGIADSEIAKEFNKK